MRSAILALPLFVAACTTPWGDAPTTVREATLAEVGSCTPIKTIRANPGVFGPLAEQGLANARKRIYQSAERDGANVVVIEPTLPGQPVVELVATAYRC